jgi:hypothetical protein
MSVIKSYSKKELAGLYNVSTKTLNKWLQPINVKIGKYSGRSFCLKQVKIIFEHLGEPEQ